MNKWTFWIKEKRSALWSLSSPSRAVQGNSKANCADTLKTNVTLGPALGKLWSTFPFFFFLSKIVHLLIEIDEMRGAVSLGPRVEWIALREPYITDSARQQRKGRHCPHPSNALNPYLWGYEPHRSFASFPNPMP